MLKLSISASVEKFRADFKSWLKKHRPPTFKLSDSFEKKIERARCWQAQLASERWLGVHWPCSYGGRGLSLVEEAIIQEELARVSAPQLPGLFGLSMVGPVLIQHGSEAQRSRFLPKILSAEEIWCQGFSEPGAGSDLAAIKTRATAENQGYRVNGQKIWTSLAQFANYCFLLCRTSEEQAKHRGLSYLLVDMRAQGIQRSPLRQISGDDEFNQLFFDNVFVPDENRVGEAGQGWAIAIATLMYERVILTFSRQLQSESALRELLAFPDICSDSRLSQRMVDQVVTSCALRALAYSHLTTYADGQSPGPEGSLDKLLWSESFQEICKMGMEVSGKHSLLGVSKQGAKNKSAEFVHRYLYSRGRTIAAGTSEIQRNIIAERILGLPRMRS